MKVIAYVCVIVFAMMACNNPQHNQASKVNTRTVEIDTSVVSAKKTVNSVEEHSEVFNKFFRRLQKDGYKVDTIVKNEISFKAYDRKSKTKDPINTMTVSNIHGRYYFLKRKQPTKPGGNTYPRFDLMEFVFDSEEHAKNSQLSIDSIINCTGRIDLKNEKIYDYGIRFSNRIIYVSYNSMYLSTYSNDYKRVIEELVVKSNVQ